MGLPAHRLRTSPERAGGQAHRPQDVAPLLRQRDVRAAALASAVIALAATPFTAPGVPILAAAAGVPVARFVRPEPA